MTKILVAEDNGFLLRAIRDTLELNGYSVCGVTNGLQAMKAFNRFRPDLIITDVTMPEMDGFELYRRVQRESPGMTIPFIFISARDEAQAVEQITNNNGTYFLRKPFGPEELLETASKLSGRHEPIPASSAGLSPARVSGTERGLGSSGVSRLAKASC